MSERRAEKIFQKIQRPKNRFNGLFKLFDYGKERMNIDTPFAFDSDFQTRGFRMVP